ncbi:hypothetical protein VCHC55A1_2343 [Vibrio cholerae HC-55A1]|nr:hypothetical protein VCHC55A1_2343 [Vibrio cholerae HC-55A1]
MVWEILFFFARLIAGVMNRVSSFTHTADGQSSGHMGMAKQKSGVYTPPVSKRNSTLRVKPY